MIVVLADDFSGASEIAGLAYRYGLKTVVQTEWMPCEADCVVIDTNTRSLPTQEAVDRVTRISQVIRESGAKVFYKKIDCVLRGPIVPEAEAVAGTFGLDRVLIGNANPSIHRVVFDARMMINGIPVDQTVFSRDPEHPRLTDNVYELLSLDETKLHKFTVIEASSTADLAGAATMIDSATLVCGASDFFEACLRERFQLDLPQKYGELLIGNQALLVCGSSVGSPPPGLVCSSFDLAKEVVSPLVVQHHLIRGGMAKIHATYADSQVSPTSCMEQLARLARTVIQREMVHDLLIEGGRTASTIVRACGFHQLQVTNSYGPGVTGMEPIRKNCVLHVIVKPGSYPWQPGQIADCSDGDTAPSLDCTSSQQPHAAASSQKAQLLPQPKTRL